MYRLPDYGKILRDQTLQRIQWIDRDTKRAENFESNT
jgi:hypothetical protein